ncbi:patatin-like phospholipase family protein [Methylobacterium sp. WSM2598]|uniref:patatin-like phospholipase family protein n=1 Tax=Methylobacterium sp. WSM2598 TaxID=398261 RepID=UPI0003829E6D|nr:patatin-like phospholipase family protein [Methylobacterium sp. WSM2598]
MFDAVAFAGGGNRCYWQGGFWAAAAERLRLSPSLVVGVSGGAFAACYSLLGQGRAVMERVAEGCAAGTPNLDWRAACRGGRAFPVSALYRDLIDAVLGPAAFAALRAGPAEVRIALARPPRRLPLAAAIPLGILTYQVEKTWRAPVHPRGGRALGFREEFVSVRDLGGAEELAAALMASASVPPFMPVGRVGDGPALDGGLVDNVPVAPLAGIEAAGGRSLVLLTRRYRSLPQHPGRTYLQPSAPVAIGQFDITDPDGIRRAFAQGLADGAAFAAAQGR